MTTADRVLSVLGLFTLERPEWTVDEAAQTLGLSQSTAYQYFRSLVNAGLVVAFRSGRYVLGPAIIALDRQTRRCDPFIQAAQAPMHDLGEAASGVGLALLCRLYGFTVMCVDEAAQEPPGFAVSYERGRPMPLARGAASKIILAHLPPRLLRRFHEMEADAVRDAGLGGDWDAFKQTLRDIRKAGYCLTRGDLDSGLTGISAPVFAPDGEILGSIGVVVAVPAAGDQALLISRVKDAGRGLTSALRRWS